MNNLYSDNCDYCKHCYDHENWSCDIEEPCINGNMFEPKEEILKEIRSVRWQNNGGRIMKNREIACLHYKAEGNCDLGKEGTFYAACQHCKNYRKLPGGKPARTDNRRRKMDKINKREMRYE